MKNVSNGETLNHNNIHVDHVDHVDSLPQHTYATHKLPSFTEMISSQKSRQSSEVPISSHEAISRTASNHASNLAVESNGVHTTDEDSVHAIDLSINSGSLIVHGANESHKNDSVDHILPNDSVPIESNASIGQYIAKNPNLTYKGSGDIMNMDIIFENVSIEEDVTIGTTPSMAIDSNDATNETTTTITTTVTETPIVTTAITTKVQPSDNVVKIDGIQYEIVPYEKDTCDEAKEDDGLLEKLENVETNEIVEEIVEDMVEVSTLPMIGDESFNDDNYMYNSNEVVIMTCSNFENDAEFDGVEMITNETIVEHELPESYQTPTDADECDTKSSTILSSQVDSNVDTNDIKPSNEEMIADVKEEAKPLVGTEQRDENKNVTERKRRHKIVPLLNKRSKRPQPNLIDKKIETVPSVQNDSRITEQPSNEQKPEERPEHNVDFVEQTTNIKCDNQTKDTEDNNENDDSEGQERSVMDSLVVVESQDPNDPNRTIHEVYVVDPDTNEMSDKPLDLPDDVIQRIRLSMS